MASLSAEVRKACARTFIGRVTYTKDGRRIIRCHYCSKCITSVRGAFMSMMRCPKCGSMEFRSLFFGPAGPFEFDSASLVRRIVVPGEGGSEREFLVDRHLERDECRVILLDDSDFKEWIWNGKVSRAAVRDEASHSRPLPRPRRAKRATGTFRAPRALAGKVPVAPMGRIRVGPGSQAHITAACLQDMDSYGRTVVPPVCPYESSCPRSRSGEGAPRD